MSAGTADTSRVAFEAWFSDGGNFIKSVERMGDGGYRFMQAHQAWGAWQASRKAALNEAVFACESVDDRCYDCLGQNEHEQCALPAKDAYLNKIKELL